MPWNNQGGGGGGGPWGSPGNSGGQSPWGRGGGGPTPPDLEDMLRRGQDRFRRFVPGGFGGSRGLILIGLVILVIWLLSGIYRVQPDEEGVVLRFGEYVRSAPPGLHYHMPAPIETVLLPTVTRVNRIDIGFAAGPDGRQLTTTRDVPEESLMLTGDENIIDIDFTIQWRIANARDYLFNIRNPEETVKVAAESAMREIIGQTDLQPALAEARGEIEGRSRELLQNILDEYGAGIEITQVQLQSSDPPPPVVDAFNEVTRASAERERVRNQAEAYRNQILPEARGQAERLIQEASAYREQIIANASGDAQRFLAVLESYQISPLVTARRLYLETLEQVFGGVEKVIIDGDVGGDQGVVPYLPLNELTRRGGAAATTGQTGQ
ncbi:MAG: FtsH protease activity modulator HflK [Inquilinaceae bacterium]